MLGQTFASLSNYNFRLYFCGQLVSLIGTWMQIIGQSWLVLELTHSSIALGFVSALQFTPILATVLFAGVLVDRLPKHRLLLITQSSSLVQASVLAFLTVSGMVQLWHIYVLAFTLGLLNAFDQPTRQAFIFELVGKEHVMNAVGLNSAQVNMAKLVGPAIGGLVIAQWGVGVCFMLNAASFLAVLISLLLLRRDGFRALSARIGHRAIWRELGDGVGFLLSRADLTVVVILLMGLGPFVYSTSSIIPLIAQDALHVGASQFGLLVAAVGCGSLAAALVIATGGRWLERTLLASATGFGALYMALAFAGSFAAAMVVLVLLGCCLQWFGTLTNSLLQLGSPDQLRGRVMSVFTLLTNGITPVGALFMGFMTAWGGIRSTLVAEASVCLLAVLLALLYRRRAGGNAV
jgi:predicted MFS family arabinose efflux permease